MRKFLLLGSAPGIIDWYKNNGDKFISEGYMLCAMNNAWQVDNERLRVWFRSSDFFTLSNTIKPISEIRNRFYEISHFIDKPLWYQLKGRFCLLKGLHNGN